jgi:hypothetical protein
MDAPYRTSATGSLRALSADAASRETTGTVHGRSAGVVCGAGRGVIRISSGESSGADRREGNNKTAVPALPGWIPAITSAGAANGCCRAARSAWLGLFTARSESSDHRHKPFEVDQKPCRTSIGVPSSVVRARQANECRKAA